MIAVIQRVADAEVTVDGISVGQIGRGLLALVGVARDDDEAAADRLLDRMLRYRIFADEDRKMSLDLSQIDGDLLLVSQFTLVAETGKGLRPGFGSAAAPADAARLFDHLVAQARLRRPRVATGRFGADMQVRLTNDGPVTFILTG